MINKIKKLLENIISEELLTTIRSQQFGKDADVYYDATIHEIRRLFYSSSKNGSGAPSLRFILGNKGHSLIFDAYSLTHDDVLSDRYVNGLLDPEVILGQFSKNYKGNNELNTELFADDMQLKDVFGELPEGETSLEEYYTKKFMETSLAKNAEADPTKIHFDYL